MLGLIEGWLLSQLGINCNLNKLEENNIFKDGSVLVNILQKYGLVSNSFSNNIQPTGKKVERLKNLKLLKPLFDMLKVKYNDTVINSLLENKASTIINFLYELYICLENKQHLYFIAQNNFNRVCEDTLKNVNSVTVHKNIPESKNEILPSNVCLEQPLIHNEDIIKWYKNKYEISKRAVSAKVNHSKDPQTSKEVTIPATDLKTCKPCLTQYKESFEDLPDLDSFVKSDEGENLLDYKAFITRYKSKQNSKATKKSIETAIQHELLNRTWNAIKEKEEKLYNSVISSVLLKQSHYEKQILSKLISAQNQTQTQTESKIWATKKIINEHENKISGDFDLSEQFQILEKNYKNEQKLVLELHKKLFKEKQEIRRKDNYDNCKNIVDDLLEIVASAAEYKSVNGVEVSEPMWSNWMQLFVKSQPIRLPLKFLEDSVCSDDDFDAAISFEKEQDEVLNENDIDEYLMTQGKWFYRSICLEDVDSKQRNLSFIVYRLLSIKYPLPPSPPPANLPPFQMAGVLLNFHNTDFVNKLTILLSKPGVHVFDTEMAVKKCIKQFQIETVQPAEQNLKSKKKDSSPKRQGGKDKKGSKKKSGKLSGAVKRKKSGKVEPKLINTEESKIINSFDKETQTSIVVETEEEKPIRTPLGLLGEEVSNVLKEGGDLPDSMLVSVIIEYLKSLEEFNGWLLLNYPVTIDQAFNFELSLTGKKLPVEGSVLEENKGILNEEEDEWSEKRKSRLLNCPVNETDTQSFRSYFTTFVKIQLDNKETTVTANNKLEDKDHLSNSIESYEIKEEANKAPDVLKDIYTSQGVFREFTITSPDLNSLKLLARVILKEDGIDRKPSVSLFGEDTLNKLTKSKKNDTKRKKSSAKIKNPKARTGKNAINKTSDTLKKPIDPTSGSGSIVDINQDVNKENLDENPKKEQNDQNWNFVSLPLNNEFGVLLATVWENIESCYITNLKESFFENRFINLRLHPYCVYVEKEIKKVIDKEDLKQNLIDYFQEYYNTISNELRTLPEVKNQLHCRVLELQQSLWEIADQRKNEIEKKRQELIFENWLVSEICLLINNYLSFVQAELERSVETLQLVNDYYMNMLEKAPLTLNVQPENRTVDRISVEMLLNTISSSDTDQEGSADGNSMNKTNNFIAHSLVLCLDEDKPINIFESIFLEKIKEVKNNYNAISRIFHDQKQAEANIIANSNKEGAKVKPNTNKEKMSIKSKKENQKKELPLKSSQSDQEDRKSALVKETLIEEWQTTINTEIERFNFRLDLIHKRANENIFEFYCFLESVFCNLHTSIISSYNTEISNINLICDYLKTATEEESPLHDPLILGQEQFVVAIKDTKTRTLSYSLKELKENLYDCTFTVRQLNDLMDIFRISGPMGVIRKQPLCLILRDLLILDTYDNHPYLPKMWGLLNDIQLRNVIDKMFGPEFGVDWKDFIIYNLDVPYPEVKDILHLRKQFLSFDLEETELILVEDYEHITLWFENELPSSPQQGLRFALVKKLLSAMFKVDKDHINYTALLLYFSKDFNPVDGLKKALSLSLGKNVVVSKLELEMILQNEKEVDGIVCSVLKEIIDGIVMTRETAQISEIIESHSRSDLISEESLEDSWRSSQLGSLKYDDLLSLETDPELIISSPFPLHRYDTPPANVTKSREKTWISRIPLTSVLSVLNASFFYQDKRYALKNQYLNCLEDEVDSDGMIEAYDLVNLSCIKKLFSLTNKFKISLPCDLLKECLIENSIAEDDLMSKQRSSSVRS